MLSSKLFTWQKNKKKHTVYKNKKNEELIQKLRSEGITDEKILSAVRMVPRELFTEKSDEAYENNNHESDQHQEHCDWIYGNCNCRISRGEDE